MNGFVEIKRLMDMMPLSERELGTELSDTPFITTCPQRNALPFASFSVSTKSPALSTDSLASNLPWHCIQSSALCCVVASYYLARYCLFLRWELACLFLPIPGIVYLASNRTRNGILNPAPHATECWIPWWQARLLILIPKEAPEQWQLIRRLCILSIYKHYDAFFPYVSSLNAMVWYLMNCGRLGLGNMEDIKNVSW